MEFNTLKKFSRSRDYFEGYPLYSYMFGDEAGKFSENTSIADVVLDGKHVEISLEKNGRLHGNGSMEDEVVYDMAYTYSRDGQETRYEYKGGYLKHLSNKEGQYKMPSDIETLRGEMLERKQLEALVAQDKLSEKDMLKLAFNLNVRHGMPNKLRDFEDFSDLTKRIQNAPDDLPRNLESVYRIMNINSDNLKFKKLLVDLRNTEDKNFNIKVRKEMKNVLDGRSGYLAKSLKPLTKRKYFGANPTLNVLGKNGR